MVVWIALKKLIDSARLGFLFQLADRWGEPDPRKIAALPNEILTHLQVFFLLEREPEGADITENEVIAHDDVNQ
ncbi:hypothetical protein [Arsenophonus endosymbiont of Aleurodicus floccissimus]|uniref:hypothetical protein n=1 Tax=Arsenophonus endosymbiont of Aleurodicus floccissimus TaxID=2152761 RepID=UPI000E6B171C|nr:hypothetical protein [Arsenophonus endosymbiont of Aleurodicus floccissimus]